MGVLPGDVASNPPIVRRRHVFHVAGYDPIGAAWYRLFRRELGTFARAWNVSAAVSESDPSQRGLKARWSVATSGPNWQVETTYELLLWDDIVQSDFGRSMLQRLAKSSHAFVDIVTTGTAIRYMRANWQYALFFLFPFFLLLVFAVAAVLLGHWLASAMVISQLLYVLFLVALSLAIFFILLYWPGRRWGLHQALDDWIFSHGYVYGRRPDVDARVDAFAERLVARARDKRIDELVIVGHSMGATLALEIVTRALMLDQNFAANGPVVCLLTVGSTIPKFSLHPAGERFRRNAARLADEPSVGWAEYHARSDAISFYKFDPVKLSRFYGDPMSGKPLLRRVRIQQMLTPRSYWRYRLRFMRLHYQFVMANERRSTYDYFMLVCGPVPFARFVMTPKGPLELIAPDGALMDVATPPPTLPSRMAPLACAADKPSSLQ